MRLLALLQVTGDPGGPGLEPPFYPSFFFRFGVDKPIQELIGRCAEGSQLGSSFE